jgi:hypothetical protein
MNNAWDAYVEVMVDHHPPTTIVGVTLLGGGSAYLIEIEAIAALPGTAWQAAAWRGSYGAAPVNLAAAPDTSLGSSAARESCRPA